MLYFMQGGVKAALEVVEGCTGRFKIGKGLYYHNLKKKSEFWRELVMMAADPLFMLLNASSRSKCKKKLFTKLKVILRFSLLSIR